MKKVEQPKVQGMMLKRKTMSERVVVWLEKPIVHGELRPGDELLLNRRCVICWELENPVSERR